mmetsp:Transcript_2666/g.4163  ORF Transcript_2666/g.4163 Transcript_2666/m.4163 type:complete len:127 (+) Transcript_2666:1044-1424(+)
MTYVHSNDMLVLGSSKGQILTYTLKVDNIGCEEVNSHRRIRPSLILEKDVGTQEGSLVFDKTISQLETKLPVYKVKYSHDSKSKSDVLLQPPKISMPSMEKKTSAIVVENSELPHGSIGAKTEFHL